MKRPIRVAIATTFGMVILLLAAAGVLQWNHAMLARGVADGRSGGVPAVSQVGAAVDRQAAVAAQQQRAVHSQIQVFLVLAISFLVFVALSLIVVIAPHGPGSPRPLLGWAPAGMVRHAETLGVGAGWGA